MTPRGIRLNNPGNIRHSKTIWQGEAQTQTDPDFVTFNGPEWGLRAIARILIHYQDSGLATVRQMISRWAPPNENNTEAYVQAVARGVGVDPDTSFDINTPGLMSNMISAIVLHENGQQPYPSSVIAKGISLALLEAA